MNAFFVRRTFVFWKLFIFFESSKIIRSDWRQVTSEQQSDSASSNIVNLIVSDIVSRHEIKRRSS